MWFISAFALLVYVPAGITSSAVGIKTCAITPVIKKYKLIIKKKKNNDKIVLLRKDKLNATEVQISKALIEPYINNDDFVSLNLLKEHNEIKNYV